jgi:hypothetical protein
VFKTEELENLDIENIRYAVVIKESMKTKKTSTIQTWIDENTYNPIKLLPSY